MPTFGAHAVGSEWRGSGGTPRRYGDGLMSVRPTPEQVLLLAPDRAAAAAATTASDPGAWSAAGCDDDAVWGQYIATSAEPYDVAVDLGGPAFRCSCPSRKVPCKHCLGLLLMHAQQHVAPARRLPFAQQWMQRRDRHPTAHLPGATPDVPDVQGAGDDEVAVEGDAAGVRTGARSGANDQQREQRQLDRAERMRAGLTELDRWLADRVRTGLAAPALAEADTWDRLAARLVDAQCGGLANRVKRVATRIGQHARWHEDVLEEMAVLHALAQGALRTSTLPIEFADGVHAAIGPHGQQGRRAGRRAVHRPLDRAGREPRPRGQDHRAAHLARRHRARRPMGASPPRGRCCSPSVPSATRSPPNTTWPPSSMPTCTGTRVRSRCAPSSVGCTTNPGASSAAPTPSTVADAVGAAGWAMARRAVARAVSGGGAGRAAAGRQRTMDARRPRPVRCPIVPGFWRLAELVAISGGRPIVVMGELSADGILPLTVWADGGLVLL